MVGFEADGDQPTSDVDVFTTRPDTLYGATFFVVGARAERHPELVARILAEGHEIGNHTWDHPSLPAVTQAEAEAQLSRTADALAPHMTSAGAYVNALPDDDGDPVRDAYGDKYERLREIKGRYDPDNVFRHNANIT